MLAYILYLKNIKNFAYILKTIIRLHHVRESMGFELVQGHNESKILCRQANLDLSTTKERGWVTNNSHYPTHQFGQMEAQTLKMVNCSRIEQIQNKTLVGICRGSDVQILCQI